LASEDFLVIPSGVEESRGISLELHHEISRLRFASLEMTKQLLLGAHMSIRGGVSMAIERARSIQCTAMQIFVKNNMQWFARPLRRDEISAFLDHVQRGALLSIFAHANYLINLAATNPQFRANSIRALSEELTRADQLQLPFLVVHPGAHLGAGEEAGLERIVESIDRVLDGLPKTKTRVALETTAGYDISTDSSVRKTLREFDRVIGRNRLVAIHLNDSKTACCSRVDRHEHIGKGRIGLDAFGFIMRDRRLSKIPKVLETPKGKDLAEDVVNLRALRALANAQT
jgi:deoxyribonuclease-4